MRMWNVPTKIMCNQHLLGEHVEMHMFVGAINKGMSIFGYINSGLVDTSLIVKRHTELAKEMEKRKISHLSPLPKFKIKNIGKVNKELNIFILINRCHKCKELYNKYFNMSERRCIAK